MSGAALGALSADQARALHARLLVGEPDAPADLAAAYLMPLIAWLLAGNPRLDPHLCESAAGDAIISLIKNPGAYKPERSPLDAYMRMAAAADLKNLLAREHRHSSRRADLEAVELSPVAGKYLQDSEADPAIILERREEAMVGTARALAPPLQAGLSPGEQRVWVLMCEGERRTAVFAAALGITHLPVAEQRRAVKRAKDRLQKRRHRAGGRHG